MFRTIVFGFLVLASSSVAVAQFDTVDTAWERELESPSYGGLHPIEVEVTSDGGVLVLGLARELPLDDFMGGADVVVMKYDENGDLAWSDTLDSPPIPSGGLTGGRYADAVVDDQGNTFLVVSRTGNSLLRSYRPDGGLAWQTTLATTGIPGTNGWYQYQATKVGLQPTGDVIVMGVVMEGAYPRADVRAFGSDGTFQWQWRGDGGVDFASTAQAYPLGLAIATDGSLYLYGQSDSPFYQHTGLVTALDPNGNYRWKTSTPGGFGIGSLDFDTQGDLLVLGGSDYPTHAGFVIVKLLASGIEDFSVFHTEAGYKLGGNSIAVDAFDRIFVAGTMVPDGFGARDATLFRFDPSGVPLGRSTPSVQGIAQDGTFHKLQLTTRNDVVALGYSRTGADEIICARFAPDGSERWALRRRGAPPQVSGSTSTGFGFGTDPRGNLFTLAQTLGEGV